MSRRIHPSVENALFGIIATCNVFTAAVAADAKFRKNCFTACSVRTGMAEIRFKLYCTLFSSCGKIRGCLEGRKSVACSCIICKVKELQSFACKLGINFFDLIYNDLFISNSDLDLFKEGLCACLYIYAVVVGSCLKVGRKCKC